jgi:hypothetical protein
MENESYRDGDVIGIDTDKCLILWNGSKKQGENCGETLEQFGIENLFPKELKRLGIDQIDASIT